MRVVEIFQHLPHIRVLDEINVSLQNRPVESVYI